MVPVHSWMHMIQNSLQPIDTYGRYATQESAPDGLWNLSRFGETLLPSFMKTEIKAVQLAQDAINGYDLYHKAWISGMSQS